MDAKERERLGELLEYPWEYLHSWGYHTCELCRSNRSNGSLFVPGEGAAAPAGILHYVDVHNYLPPRVFLDAVLACPPMGSDEYFAALATAGGKKFVKMVSLGKPRVCPYCGKELIPLPSKRCYYCKKGWQDPENGRRPPIA
jgi:hypothetical protein